MFPIDQVRDALRERGYRDARIAKDRNMQLILMTDGYHVLVLQEYADGRGELYGPLGQNDDVQSIIDAIPTQAVAQEA